LKKVKKNWPHELKRGSILLRKCKAPNQEANPQPLAWQTWKVSVRPPDQCWLSKKMTTLFEMRHARRKSNKFWNTKIHGWFCSHFQV